MGMDQSESNTRYYAHTTSDPSKIDWQPLQEHLQNVAALAAEYASAFGAGEWGAVAGLLHDLGKYSSDFQRRLEGCRDPVDHSTAGALEARKRLGGQSRPLEYVVAGHHGGLHDFYGFQPPGLDEKLHNGGKLPDYSAYHAEIEIPSRLPVSSALRTILSDSPFSRAFFIRMLFSCLVDADSLDTERFADPGRAAIRGTYDPVDRLADTFFRDMDALTGSAAPTPINSLRQRIFEECLKMAERPPGLFTLTVPTGGGKTRASLAFALRHMQRYNLRQIVYVLPYTSIIEQNAKVFRGILGAGNVLEHHSNFDPRTEGEVDDSARDLNMIVAENWDIPVTVTTNVQFFESLFSNKRSRCRKIHRLARSVIILDEAQMLPTPFLRPCVEAIVELVRHYGATVVFCTATQPRIAGLIRGPVAATEIMSSPSRLYEQFRRVRTTNLGSLSDGPLVHRLSRHPQVLCIVNRKAHASLLVDALAARCHARQRRRSRKFRRRGWRTKSRRTVVFHLTANMCPVHRRRVLALIRRRLDRGSPCRVVSTQLIEAGVDIDFPVVYRSMTGIDSIAQAAGRCNREGRLPEPGRVYVFTSTEVHGKASGWLSRTAEIGSMVMSRHDDPLSLEAVADYFETLYAIEQADPRGLDKEGIMKKLHGSRQDSLAFPFKEVGDSFRLIEGTRDVIIPYDDEARSAIAQLESGFISQGILRRLQGYAVSVYPHTLKRLEEAGAVHYINNRFIVLNNLRAYSEEKGLEVKNEQFDGLLLVDDWE